MSDQPKRIDVRTAVQSKKPAEQSPDEQFKARWMEHGVNFIFDTLDKAPTPVKVITGVAAAYYVIDALFGDKPKPYRPRRSKRRY